MHSVNVFIDDKSFFFHKAAYTQQSPNDKGQAGFATTCRAGKVKDRRYVEEVGPKFVELGKKSPRKFVWQFDVSEFMQNIL